MRKMSLDEYKKRILNVLIKIDDICRKNHLRYCICYGTLLGAVRHKGFIPWDDDIDIVMPRKDYYLLGKYILKHPELELNYIDISNRKDTTFYCAKVCDSHTVVREFNIKPLKGYGAFVDVFPFDFLPENEIERKKYMNKALYWERIVQHSIMVKPLKGDNLKHDILLKASFAYSHLFNTSKTLMKMHREFRKNDRNKTEYVGVPYDPHVFLADWFAGSIDIDFEGHKFLAPAEYDKVLTARYGNYMQLPPEEERIYKHHLDCYEK